MADVEFKPNKGALKPIMQSPQALTAVRAYAQGIANRASSQGGTYIVKSDIGKVSARAVAVTADYKAMIANAKNNALLKSI